jgi:hypothetical protein
VTLVPRVLLFVTLAEPTPSGSTGMSRLCQGCSHPPRHLPGQAALSCTALLRRDGDEGLPPPFKLSAPHGAPGSRLRRGRALAPDTTTSWSSPRVRPQVGDASAFFLANTALGTLTDDELATMAWTGNSVFLMGGCPSNWTTPTSAPSGKRATSALGYFLPSSGLDLHRPHLRVCCLARR